MMNKSTIDEFCTLASSVMQELLTYAQLSALQRNEDDEGQIRRLRGIAGALNAGLEAARAPTMLPTAPAPFALPPAAARVS